jgi:chromosome segregation protein
MRLSKIKLTGFKSFTDATEIIFPEQVSAIVGPNGCGKSNIADALRWVLGEQSSRAMRAERMEDVIFSGAMDRAPLGMAEVEITLEGRDGLNDEIETYGGDEQLTITRRIFRNKESQFYINKKPCRLRDIHSLLAGTGLGKSAYSVLEQGMVDIILSSKPEERRTVIDEAAGISGYRAKKQESLRKMEKTDENLLRLSDIKNEVRRQAEGLRQQAEKAQAFAEYRNELLALDLTLVVDNRKNLQEKLSSLNGELTRLEERRLNLSVKLTQMEEESARLRMEDAHRSGEMVNLANQMEEKRSLIKDLERECAVIVAQREAQSQELKEKETDLTDLEEALERSRAESDSILTNFSQVSQRRERIRKLSLRTEKILEIRQKRLAGMEREIQSLKCAMVDRNAQQSVNRSRLEELRLRLGELSIAVERLERELAELSAERKEIEGKTRDKEKQTKSLSAELAEAVGKVSRQKVEVEQILTELSRMGEEVSRLDIELATTESRIGWLEGLIANHEGLGQGARHLLAEKKRNAGSFGWLLGSLLESLQVEESYQRAIKVALEPWREALVVNNGKQALHQGVTLSHSKRGRAIFIPADLPKMDTDRDRTGMLCFADEVVDAGGKFSSVASYLLRDVGIVKDLASGEALLRKGSLPRGGVVTLSGEMLLSGGIVVAGDEPGEDLPFLSRKKTLENERKRLEELKRTRENRSRELEKLEQKKLVLEERFAQEDERIKHQELALEGLRVEVLSLGESLEEIARKEELRQQELKELSRAREEFTTSLQGQELELVSGENREKEFSERLTLGEKDFGRLTIALESAKRRQSNIGLIMAESERSHQRVTEELSKVRGRTEELQAQIKSRKERIVELGSLIQNGRLREKAISGENGQENKLLNKIKTERESIQKRRQPLESVIAKLETTLKGLRTEEHQLSEKVTQTMVEKEQLEGKLTALAEAFSAKYNSTIDEQLEQTPELPPLEDKSGTKARVAELEKEISALGKINFTAAEEYAAFRERDEFLEGQEKDLLQAKENLIATIAHIDQQCTSIFLDTFNKVGESFSTIFSDIFGGGKARLSLSEDCSPLEAGLIIEAQPPGKRMRALSLLSGGERALVAISLLFALYLVKPTPFCILDEVDAALDDPNVDRFNELINRFKASTQFILITHNKRTMEVADTIFGVTMEIPGVSQLFSINLKEREEELVG